MSLEDRQILYNNIKKNEYFLFHNFERYLNDLFKKYGINNPNIFIELPLISYEEIVTNEKLDNLIKEFKEVYKDTHDIILETYINEFKRQAKINKKTAHYDIKRLIDMKNDEPKFKLIVPEYNLEIDPDEGEYSSSDETIMINLYGRGILSPEISHLLLDADEEETNIDLCNLYRKIRRSIRRKETINRIVRYLNEFHDRFSYMKEIFKELYYNEIKRKYGDIETYRNVILSDLRKYRPEFITFDEIDTCLYVDYRHLFDTVDEIIHNELLKYQKIMTYNYYTEELMLENLLDALLNGSILDGKYDVECKSGHHNSYFKLDKNLSLNEAIANYYAIKNSSKSNILTNKLRMIVGDEIVDLFEEYLEVNRTHKIKKK